MARTKLNRTAGSTGNRRTWTWSGWVKRAAVPGTADAKGGLFATYTDGSPISLTMTLSFTEIMPVYNEDYDSSVGGVGY